MFSDTFVDVTVWVRGFGNVLTRKHVVLDREF